MRTLSCIVVAAATASENLQQGLQLNERSELLRYYAQRYRYLEYGRWNVHSDCPTRNIARCCAAARHVLLNPTHLHKLAAFCVKGPPYCRFVYGGRIQHNSGAVNRGSSLRHRQ